MRRGTHNPPAVWPEGRAEDYLLSEKLLNFAEAAATRPDFAQELPLFVAQVRRCSHKRRSGLTSLS